MAPEGRAESLFGPRRGAKGGAKEARGLFALLFGRANAVPTEVSLGQAKAEKAANAKNQIPAEAAPQGKGLSRRPPVLEGGLQEKLRRPAADPAILENRDSPKAEARANRNQLERRQAPHAEAEARPENSPRPAELRERKRRPELSAEENAAAQDLARQLTSSATVKPKAAAPLADPEGEAKIRESEKSKSRDLGASEPRLSVLDLRRERRRAESLKDSPDADKAADRIAAEGPRTAGVEDRGANRELLLELGSPERGARPGEGTAESAPAAGSDFSSVLADKLKESWNGEIVKSAQIILRDGDSGSIRLRLHPESLGNVKIELNLAENSISGRIVVESDEAKSAFERSMSQLQDAFREGGFESAKLEVSVGGSGQDGGFAQGEGSRDSGSPFFSERLRSAAFEESVPLAASYNARSGRGLDILA